MFINHFKRFASSSLLACAAFVCMTPAAAQPARLRPVPFKVAARLPDVLAMPEPFEVRLGGFLGARVSNNEKNRLLKVDEDDLLDAFERREVEHQVWQGEHAGKFLHAATLAWAYTGDAALKTKLDRVGPGSSKRRKAMAIWALMPKTGAGRAGTYGRINTL